MATMGIRLDKRRRLRVGRVNVTLRPELLDPAQSPAECVKAFEDFCIVTQSVRQGIDVTAHVDLEGTSARREAGGINGRERSRVV
jgi:hypothetical protein